MSVVIDKNQFGDMMYNEFAKTQNIMNPKYSVVEIGKDDDIVIGGGLTFTKRWQEAMGDWETVTSSSFSATSQVLDQKQSVLMNLMTRKVLEQSKYDGQHTGVQPLEVTFQKYVAEGATLSIQQNLAASIKGAFLATDATAFKTDISAATVSYPTFDSIVDVIAGAYPDKDENIIKAMVVHADIYAVLLKDAASSLSGGEMVDGMYTTGQILSIAGMTVIKNSTIAYKTGTGDSAVYKSYFMAENVLTVDFQRQLEISEDIDINKGTESAAADISFFAGCKNASWKGTLATIPTLTALATGTNWEWNEFDTQDVGIHELTSLKV